MHLLVAPYFDNSRDAVINVDVPVNPIPGTGAANFGSLDPIGPPGPNGQIDGTIAQYAELNVDSITVEFWAHTNENAGSLVTRRVGNTGFEIFNFNDVQVSYFVEDGLGGTDQILLDPSGANTINMDQNWVKSSFTNTPGSPAIAASTRAVSHHSRS